MNALTPAYTAQEIDAIARWLGEECSASEIAVKLSQMRNSPISRNAIIGIIHRNKRLAAIGLHGRLRRPGGSVKAPPSVPRVARAQNFRAANIRGKKEGRAFDPGFSAPKPRSIDDGIAPHVYDSLTSRHVPISALTDGECRWPVNDAAPGAKHLFCGQPAGLSSYCEHHCRRAGSGYRAEQTATVRSVAGQAARQRLA